METLAYEGFPCRPVFYFPSGRVAARTWGQAPQVQFRRALHGFYTRFPSVFHACALHNPHGFPHQTESTPRGAEPHRTAVKLRDQGPASGVRGAFTVRRSVKGRSPGAAERCRFVACRRFRFGGSGRFLPCSPHGLSFFFHNSHVQPVTCVTKKLFRKFLPKRFAKTCYERLACHDKTLTYQRFPASWRSARRLPDRPVSAPVRRWSNACFRSLNALFTAAFLPFSTFAGFPVHMVSHSVLRKKTSFAEAPRAPPVVAFDAFRMLRTCRIRAI